MTIQQLLKDKYTKDQLVNLKVLNLSDNQLSKIEGLDQLVNLKVLWLSNNQLSQSEIKEFKESHPNIQVYS